MTTKLKSTASFFMTAFMVVFLAATICAQPQGQGQRQQGPPPIPNEEQIENMVDDLAEACSLSDEQKTQVEEKYKAHFEEVSAKMKSGRPDRTEMEKLKSTFEKEVKALLNKNQKKKYNSFLKKMESQGQGNNRKQR